MQNVAEVLDRLEALGTSGDRVTVDDVREALGRDAFYPALLTAGLLALSPLGDLPGGSALFGLVIVAITAQLLFGRRELWLPRRLARQSFDARRLHQTARALRPAARVLGVVVRERLSWLTRGPFARAIAGLCLVLALTMPPLEVVPFGATIPSAAITGFSIALLARDGLLALLTAALLAGGGWLLLGLAT
ncbi:MAG: exopolysaccharide biosynthesis protein [Paracoccaceae bacterium]